MIIGITGTREGLTQKQMMQFHKMANNIEVIEIHHGGCVGVDQQIGVEIKDVYPACIKEIIHKPKYNTSKYFLQRNREIVDSCDVLWAFPKGMDEELRSGTWATIRYARKQNKPMIIIYPDASIVSNF